MRWLLIRGLSRDARHWGSFPQTFAEELGVEVQTIDPPGFGTQITRTSPSTIAKITNDIRDRATIQGDDWSILGISLGGMVSPEACHLEPRFRACLVMEAPMPADVVKSGLQQPSMWILSDVDTWRLQRWSELDVNEHQTMRALFESLPGDGYFVQVPRMFHLNLTDVPLLIYAPFGRKLGLFGPIDAHRVHRIVNAYTIAFFDRHLKGLPATLLDGPAAQYPDVRFETRRP